MIARLFILILLAALTAPGFAKPAAPGPKLADMMLSPREFFSLDAEQRVAYFKFLMNLVATIEDLQDVPAGRQTAAFISPRWYGFLIDADSAFAASLAQALEGQSCLHSLNQSHWVYDRAKGRLYCAAAADSGGCGGGQVACAQQLTDMTPGLGRICIKARGAGVHPGLTARCVDAIAAKAGASLDARLRSKALSYTDAGQRNDYAKFSAGLKTALERFEQQRGADGMSLSEYCRNPSSARKSASYGLQKEECAAYQKLVSTFEVITTDKQNPYKPNAIKAEAADLTSAHALGLKLAGKTADTAVDEAPAGSAADIAVNTGMDDGKGGPVAAPLSLSGKVPVPAARPEPKKTKTTKKKPQTGDCMSRYRAQLGALACVACGLEDAADADIKHGRGVGNWLSLVGIMAQSYYGPYNTQDSLSRKAFQQRVIDMVSSYGYCTDNEYRVNTGSAADSVRAWLDGRKRLHQGLIFPNADEKRFVALFGLGSDRKSLFGGVPDSGLSYASQIFDDSGRTGFDRGNVQERQWRFRSMLKAHRNSYPTTAFSKCAAQLESRLTTSSSFRMCPIKIGHWKNGAERMIYPKSITDRELSANGKIRGAMAESCGLTAKSTMPSRRCDNQCWYNYTYRSMSSTLRNCDHGGQEAYRQGGGGEHGSDRGEPSHGRSHGDPGGGDRGEPSSSRSGSYGGDHGSTGGGGGGDGGAGTGGDTGGGGKGGESSSSR